VSSQYGTSAAVNSHQARLAAYWNSSVMSACTHCPVHPPDGGLTEMPNGAWFGRPAEFPLPSWPTSLPYLSRRCGRLDQRVPVLALPTVPNTIQVPLSQFDATVPHSFRDAQLIFACAMPCAVTFTYAIRLVAPEFWVPIASLVDVDRSDVWPVAT
jgi:hypothetical protein